MNEFVEACRREWGRLNVPDPVANEMAADLQADLDEAAADGASPEDVLGTGAFDPESFAASWATERGVARPVGGDGALHMPARRPRWRTGMVVALAGVGLVALVVCAGVALAMHPFGSSAQAAIASPLGPRRLIAPNAPNVMLRPLHERGADLRVAVAALGFLALVGGLVVTTLFVLWWSPGLTGGRWSRLAHDRDRATDDRD